MRRCSKLKSYDYDRCDGSWIAGSSPAMTAVCVAASGLRHASPLKNAPLLRHARSAERAFEILHELLGRDRLAAHDVADRLGVLMRERAVVAGPCDRHEVRNQPVRHVARFHAG